jgi:hypothetical protein
MKFVPFIPSNSSRKSIDKVETRLAWHVHSKATEVSFNLEMVDIYEPKVYLNNKSIEQVLRGVMSKKIPNVPVLKNIVRRWTPIPAEIKYKITAYGILGEEAESLIQTLKSDLHTMYNDGVLQHFPNESLLTSYSYSVDRDRNEEADPDIEKLVADSEDNAEGILEPGFLELIQAQEYGLMGETGGGDNSTMRSSILGKSTKGPDTQVANSQGSKSQAGSFQGDSTMTERSKVSDVTEESMMSAISWRKDVINTDKNNAEWVESTRVQKKLDDANITSAAFNDWKDTNKEFVEKILFSQKNIYEATKQMILLMKGEMDGMLKKTPPTESEGKGNQERQLGQPEEAPPNS